MAATFSQWIDGQRWFHALVRRLRLRGLISHALRVRPWTRTFRSGARVQITDLESFYLSDEIFGRESYRRALELAGDVRMVADVGCNIGFFCCYLRAFYGRQDFRGVGFDANAGLLEQTRRNLKLNGLEGIRLRHGLAGASTTGATQEFYLYPSHLGSSQFQQPETGRALKGDWRKVVVPVLQPSAIWREQFGDAPIDLLKVDIEGSEGKLLENDPELFRLARCVVLEWHRWLVPEEQLFPALRALGFTHQQALQTGETADLWFFARGKPYR